MWWYLTTGLFLFFIMCRILYLEDKFVPSSETTAKSNYIILGIIVCGSYKIVQFGYQIYDTAVVCILYYYIALLTLMRTPNLNYISIDPLIYHRHRFFFARRPSQAGNSTIIGNLAMKVGVISLPEEGYPFFWWRKWFLRLPLESGVVTYF